MKHVPAVQLDFITSTVIYCKDKTAFIIVKSNRSTTPQAGQQ